MKTILFEKNMSQNLAQYLGARKSSIIAHISDLDIF